MVRPIRETEKLLGRVDYGMSAREQNSRKFARSLYVAQDIQKGELFTEQNIRSVRPSFGMHPKHLGDILGKRANKNYRFGDRLENFR